MWDRGKIKRAAELNPKASIHCRAQIGSVVSGMVFTVWELSFFIAGELRHSWNSPVGAGMLIPLSHIQLRERVWVRVLVHFKELKPATDLRRLLIQLRFLG